MIISLRNLILREIIDILSLFLTKYLHVSINSWWKITFEATPSRNIFRLIKIHAYAKRDVSLNGSFLRGGGHRARVLITGHRGIENPVNGTFCFFHRFNNLETTHKSVLFQSKNSPFFTAILIVIMSDPRIAYEYSWTRCCCCCCCSFLFLRIFPYPYNIYSCN